MKKIKLSISFLLFACLMTGVGLFSSCSKDDNGGSLSDELLSFGPTGAELGDTISFIGNGLDRVTMVVFVGDSVSKPDFVSQTSSLLKVIAPPNARRGYVILRNSNGTSVQSLTMIDFLIQATFTDVTPMPAKPGTNITITGEHLDWATDVVFFNNAGNITVTDTFFVSQSASQIVVTVPINAQRGPLVVHTAGTKPLAITMTDFPVILPVITDFSPNPILGGKEQLTINGTDLDLVTGVLLKGPGMDTIKTFVSQTPTQIVIAPPANTAPGPITIIPYSMLPVVSSTSLNVVLPAITAISPNPITRGDNLTITGTDLDLVTGVIINGVADPISSFVSQSATKIVVTVPQDAQKGPVKVVSAAGVPAVSADVLTFNGDITETVIWTGTITFDTNWGTYLQLTDAASKQLFADNVKLGQSLLVTVGGVDMSSGWAQFLLKDSSWSDLGSSNGAVVGVGDSDVGTTKEIVINQVIYDAMQNGGIIVGGYNCTLTRISVQ